MYLNELNVHTVGLVMTRSWGTTVLDRPLCSKILLQFCHDQILTEWYSSLKFLESPCLIFSLFREIATDYMSPLFFYPTLQKEASFLMPMDSFGCICFLPFTLIQRILYLSRPHGTWFWMCNLCCWMNPLNSPWCGFL